MNTKETPKITQATLARARYAALEKFHNAIRLREEAERELAAVNNLAVALQQEPATDAAQ